MKIQARSATHVGRVRELNEDSFVDNSPAGVWAVADGMGGHEAGEVASKLVADSLAEMQAADSFEETLQVAQWRLEDANRRLVEQSVKYPRDRTPGTTVVALLIRGDQGAVIWAGDSRIYRKRDGEVQQLTRDHSHVQDLVDRHLIQPEEAEHHPMSNVITRAVGIEDPMEFDTRAIEVRGGDQFVLCSDGLSRLVSPDEISATLQNSDDEEIVRTLIQTALERGAPDNVTLIHVRCEDGPAAAAPDPESGEPQTAEWGDTVVQDVPYVPAREAAAPAPRDEVLGEPFEEAAGEPFRETADEPFGEPAGEPESEEEAELEAMGFDTDDFDDDFEGEDDEFEDLDWEKGPD